MEISKEQLFKEIGENDLIVINNVYLPYLGKTKFVATSSILEMTTENAVIESRVKPLKRQRKDEENTRFDIENVFVEINFNTMKIEGSYEKVWIGGLVEEFTFSHNITSIFGKRDTILNVLEIDITAELGN